MARFLESLARPEWSENSLRVMMRVKNVYHLSVSKHLTKLKRSFIKSKGFPLKTEVVLLVKIEERVV